MTWVSEWVDALRQSLTSIGVNAAEFIPRVVGMIIILVVGYVVSKVLERVTTAILKRMGFDKASVRVGLTPVLERGNIRRAPSGIVGRLAFWFFMLTFGVSAADALGLENVSRTIESFVSYLPNVVGATGIAVLGLLLAGVVRDAIREGAGGIGMEHASVLGNAAFVLLVVVIGTLAVSQLRIETALISRVIEIALIALGVSLALTLGLGTRDVARNVVAGMYARDVYAPGMVLSVNGDSGSLEEIGTVATRIRGSDGEMIFIPNGELMQRVVKGRSVETEGGVSQ